MENDEQAFDFMAAAEDTGKQLDVLLKAIPGEVRETLAAEYRKSPWLATLPATADRVTAASERAEAAAGTLTRKAKIAGVFVCVAAVAVPVSTWAYAYWQTWNVRQERDALKTELSQLQGAADLLKGLTGGGATLVQNDNGSFTFTLPPGKVFAASAVDKASVTYRGLSK